VTADRKPTIGDAIPDWSSRTPGWTPTTQAICRQFLTALGLDPDMLFDPVTDRLVVLHRDEFIGKHFPDGGDCDAHYIIRPAANRVASNPKREPQSPPGL